MRRTTETTWFIPVKYQMEGVIEIVANSFEEAERMALEDEDLPEDADYVDGSIITDRESLIYGDSEENDVDYAQEKYEAS